MHLSPKHADDDELARRARDVSTPGPDREAARVELSERLSKREVTLTIRCSAREAQSLMNALVTERDACSDNIADGDSEPVEHEYREDLETLIVQAGSSCDVQGVPIR